MPIYEYRCDACCKRFEVLRRMGEGTDGLACPECGSETIVRQLSTFAATGGSTGPGFGTRGGGCGSSGFT